jgi:uncharacterized membrane protein
MTPGQPPDQPPGQYPPPQMPYNQPPGPDEITSTDKLWAALSYVFGILAIIALVMDDTKNRRFVKYHAVQALGLWAVYVVFYILMTILSSVLINMFWQLGFLWCCFSLLYFLPWVAMIYFAYQAYQGKYFKIPILTDFLAQQKWLQKP